MLLLNLLQASGIPASEINGVSMSCVVPPLRSVFEELARKYLHQHAGDRRAGHQDRRQTRRR